MNDIFISYRREDRNHAHLLAEYFVEKGYEVWWDVDLLPGDRFADEINEVLGTVKVAIVLWTPGSVKSPWVKSEATIAFEREILIPVCLESTSIPAPFNILETLDLTSWLQHKREEDLDLLLKSVENLIHTRTSREPLRSRVEIDKVLDRPRHEVEFWASVSRSGAPSAAEYQLYLDRYGQNATFADLAKNRIADLSGWSRFRPKISGKLLLLGVIGILASVVIIGKTMDFFDLGQGKQISAPPLIAQTKQNGPADCYAGSNTFIKHKSRWYEFHDDGKNVNTFDELMVDHEYLTLVDRSRRNKGKHPMLVRVPLQGGIMDWSWQNPIRWNPMYIMTTKDPRCIELRRYL